MSDYQGLRTAAQSLADVVNVSVLELQELLHEFDLLRTGGKKAPKSAYTTEFEEAWAQYPTRPGNSKAAAFKAWTARIKAGATPEEMIGGTIKYAAYVKAERTEAHYIKQAATFYGPGEHFSADWTVKRAPVVQRQQLSLDDARRAANDEARRRLRGGPPDDGMTIDA